MTYVLTDAGESRASRGTNARIEQPFAAMMAGRRPRNPNVLYIDAGLHASQIGAYSGVGDTPHIDRLARSGVRFTAATADGSSGSDVAEILRDHGYDGGSFRLAEGGAGALEPAVSFLCMRRSAPWAAYVRSGNAAAEVDLAIGRLVHALRRTGAYRDTIVALVGAAARPGAIAPTIVSWPGQIPPRQRHDGQLSVADLTPTLLETARVGASRGIDLDGVDLTAHVFDGAPMPARPVRAVDISAA